MSDAGGKLRLWLGWLGLAASVLPGVAPLARAEVTGAEVKAAIRRGVEALRRRQNDDGTWTERNYPDGVTALATLALLQAGEGPESPSVAAALRLVQAQPNQHVYVVSLKIMVLAAADPEAYRAELNAATQWLIDAQTRTGLWTYTPERTGFDHSNSQFALLGLHSAAEVGIQIPSSVWSQAQARVLSTQRTDGGWAYVNSGTSYGSMTAAGVADLLILGHRLHERRESGFEDGAAPGCGEYRSSASLTRGLDWLGRHFRADRNPGGQGYVNYWLYAVERCGILSGLRYLGQHDWYRAGAEYLVDRQGADGLWGGDLVDTCFAVLFLAKGHKSLLVQKLQWAEDEAWNADRYDVAHLVAFIGDQLGEVIAWQSVPIGAGVEDWLSAPLLYMQGHTFPDLDVATRAKLRAFVEQGGTLLAEACCGKAAFRDGLERFMAETFPESPLRELRPEHAVYHVVHEVEPYGLRGLDWGCRTAVIYSPRDMSCLWEQAHVPGFSEAAFELGANIAAYAVGRRPLRDRLDAVVVPSAPATQPGAPAGDALRLAQVVYSGNWRPFPVAPVGLAEFLRDEAKLDVVTQYAQVRLTDADLYASPILLLAGDRAFEISEAERKALAGHLRRGGFLIADACCGRGPFEVSVRGMLEQMFPGARLERLPADHAIFTGRPGFDVRRVEYTADVQRARPELSAPELWGLTVQDRLVAVLSPYSLSCGLSGAAYDGCWGLASADAKRLAANVVLYALTH